MLRVLPFILLFFSVSCESGSTVVDHVEAENEKAVISINQDSLKTKRYLDSIYELNGLIDILKLDSSFIIDLRYSTTNNFLGRILYDSISSVYLQKEVAIRLVSCHQYLDSLHPGYHIKIFDAVRPLEVQRQMWEALDTVPVAERGKFVSNPALGSVHNFGSAVDLTICDEKGDELDMGAGYDDFRPIAFPSREYQFLQSGELSMRQVENRRLLREVMRSQKFVNIPSEWWHFNAYSRITAESKYPALITESGKFEKRSVAKRVWDNAANSDSIEVH